MTIVTLVKRGSRRTSKPFGMFTITNPRGPFFLLRPVIERSDELYDCKNF